MHTGEEAAICETLDVCATEADSVGSVLTVVLIVELPQRLRRGSVDRQDKRDI